MTLASAVNGQSFLVIDGYLLNPFLEIIERVFLRLLFIYISFILASLFISLQIKEFRIMALSINDSLYSSLFFFLTGLHFFHLTIGLFLLSLIFWSCSFSYFLSLLTSSTSFSFLFFLYLYSSSLVIIFICYYHIIISKSYLLRLVFWNIISVEVGSDSFCFLINSSWLLVFILLLTYTIYGFNLYCWNSLYFSSSNFIIMLFLLFTILLLFYYWCRDLLREFIKKYEIILVLISILLLGVIISEGLLFISFFWISFHSITSPSLGIWLCESFYIPDPCELTFTNTLLLSNAAISLGNSFITLETSSQFYILQHLSIENKGM